MKEDQIVHLQEKSKFSTMRTVNLSWKKIRIYKKGGTWFDVLVRGEGNWNIGDLVMSHFQNISWQILISKLGPFHGPSIKYKVRFTRKGYVLQSWGVHQNPNHFPIQQSWGLHQNPDQFPIQHVSLFHTNKWEKPTKPISMAAQIFNFCRG